MSITPESSLDAPALQFSMTSFRPSAEHYLHQWCGYDRDFVTAFEHAPLRPEVLAKMCDRYEVARTIPGYLSQDKKKYEAFANLLEEHRSQTITRKSLCSVIESALCRMQQAYGSRFLSAITKAFWMMHGHPVVIYDTNARQGLRRCGLVPGDGDYSEFVHSWFKFFDNPYVERGLDDALDWLSDSPCAAMLMRKHEVRNLCRTDRFRNRVVDIALFLIGTNSAKAPNVVKTGALAG